MPYDTNGNWNIWATQTTINTDIFESEPHSVAPPQPIYSYNGEDAPPAEVKVHTPFKPFERVAPKTGWIPETGELRFRCFAGISVHEMQQCLGRARSIYGKDSVCIFSIELPVSVWADASRAGLNLRTAMARYGFVRREADYNGDGVLLVKTLRQPATKQHMQVADNIEKNVNLSLQKPTVDDIVQRLDEANAELARLRALKGC